MKCFRISGIIIISCIVFTLQVKSQDDTISRRISAIESEVSDLQAHIDSLQIQLERLKLTYCHNQIIIYGLPGPIPNEQIVHHQALSLSYTEDTLISEFLSLSFSL